MAKRKKHAGIPVTVRSLDEILSTLDGDWDCEETSVRFCKEMINFTGKKGYTERCSDYDVPVYFIKGMDKNFNWEWSYKWLKFPHDWEKPIQRIRHDLIDDKEIDVTTSELVIGCTTIDKYQERKWLEVLCQRAGYVLED